MPRRMRARASSCSGDSLRPRSRRRKTRRRSCFASITSRRIATSRRAMTSSTSARVARHPRDRLQLVAVHLQEPGRVGSAVPPGLVLLSLRATPARRRRVARGDRSNDRQRVLVRGAGRPSRGRARTRHRPAPEREPRLLRDRRLRPFAGGRGRDGARRPFAVRQPLHALLDRQPLSWSARGDGVPLRRAGTVDRTVERRGYTINDWMPVRRG